MTFQYYASHPGVTNPEEHRVKYIIENDIRLMISAEHWGYPFTRYAVDNGAWTDYIKGRQFNHMRFLKVLEKIKQQEIQPDFIVLPDIVRGGIKSFELSKSYLDVADNHPCYFSIQDGITPEMITPDIIEVVNGFFIGGSNVWKWRVMNEWVTFAHEHRKKIHVGKIGTLRDFLKCSAALVDSADGSTLIRHHREKDIGRYMGIVREQSKIKEVKT